MPFQFFTHHIPLIPTPLNIVSTTHLSLLLHTNIPQKPDTNGSVHLQSPSGAAITNSSQHFQLISNLPSYGYEATPKITNPTPSYGIFTRLTTTPSTTQPIKPPSAPPHATFLQPLSTFSAFAQARPGAPSYPAPPQHPILSLDLFAQPYAPTYSSNPLTYTLKTASAKLNAHIPINHTPTPSISSYTNFIFPASNPHGKASALYQGAASPKFGPDGLLLLAVNIYGLVVSARIPAPFVYNATPTSSLYPSKHFTTSYMNAPPCIKNALRAYISSSNTS